MIVKAAALGVSAFVAWQAVGRWDAETTKSYTHPSGIQIRQEGVCRYDANRIECWNTDGITDTALTSKIQGYYLDPVNDAKNNLVCRFGEKNRLVVFSRTGGSEELQCQDSRSYLNLIQMPDEKSQRTLAWAFVSSAPTENETDLIATITDIPDGAPARVPFSEGAKTSCGSTSITLAGSQLILDLRPGIYPRNFGYYFGQGRPMTGFRARHKLRQWRYFFKVDRTYNTPIDVICHAIDTHGREIKAVDTEGHPVAEMDGPLASSHQLNDDNERVYMRTSKTNSHVVSLYSNVNPSNIRWLDISTISDYKVLFKHIPLEPRK